MFPYFGKKTRSAKLYPTPEWPLVIEPFAGSMSYTLHNRPEFAIGMESDERVVQLWRRCLSMKSAPKPPVLGSTTDDLLVKLCSYSEHSLTSGPMTVTSRMLRDWNSVHKNIIRDASWCREHTMYRHGDYSDCPDVEATWFIDPPYQYANRRGYRDSGGLIDFGALADFCTTRRGQVIVCEQDGADWLPFRPLYSMSSHRGSRSTEMIWTNR